MKRSVALAVSIALFAASVADAQIPALNGGKTIDFVYDASDVRHPEEAYEGRLFVPREVAADPRVPRPFLVFLHGVNPEHIRLRFSGGKPDEPDVRILVAQMIANGTIPPVVLGAPGTTVSSELPVTLWPGFDLDRFVERSARLLRGKATLDLDRVVLVGHSGAGCNAKGGLFSALAGTTLHLRAIMSADTCMDVDQAKLLAAAPAGTDVVVTWQPFTWKRDFDAYRAAMDAVPIPEGSRRFLEQMDPPRSMGDHHSAMVEATLARFLRVVLER